MMLLTILVWFYMYYLRISFFIRNNVNPQSVSTTRQLRDIVPETTNTPSENLINLFELPVLYYAVCIYLFLTHNVDIIYLTLAYAFVLFRAGHSLVHCTYNQVMPRFYLYLLSSIILWIFILRAFISALTA